MLAWILWGAGIALVLAGIVVSLWRRTPHANGLMALGNLSCMGYHALHENIALMALHFALGCVSVFLWVYMALDEE